MDRSKEQKILVRADGNAAIGMGHIMRTMAIVTGLKEQGWQCVYVCCAPAPTALLKRRGFEVVEMEAPYREKTVGEAREILQMMQERGISKIFLDSYFITDEYFAVFKEKVKVIYINGIRKKFDVDVLINENIACDKAYFNELYKGSGTKLLLGKEYTPLRREFLEVHYEAGEQVKNVLLTTGGGDQYNFMGQFLTKIKEKKKYQHLSFLCISGMANSHHEELEKAAEDMENVRIVHGADNMASLMAGSDLAISAGGTSVLELAAIGVPTIAFTVADDQVEGVSHMDAYGLAALAGSITAPAFWETIFCKLDILLADTEKRKAMAKEAKRQIDGKGVARICSQIADL